MTTTLITGATRGLGYETARLLAAAGHTVYLGARDVTRGAEAARLLGARAIEIDVTVEASVTAAAERVRAEAGALDILINNAGIAGGRRPPAEATTDDLRRVLDTNVVGAAAAERLNDLPPAKWTSERTSAIGLYVSGTPFSLGQSGRRGVRVT